MGKGEENFILGGNEPNLKNNLGIDVSVGFVNLTNSTLTLKLSIKCHGLWHGGIMIFS